tara:strand:- start:618 stop:734 length:117 start_codon:yes stop_codon:yes gene_type:complete
MDGLVNPPHSLQHLHHILTLQFILAVVVVVEKEQQQVD